MYSGRGTYGGNSTPAGSFPAPGFVSATSLSSSNPFLQSNPAFPSQSNPFQTSSYPANPPAQSHFASAFPTSGFGLSKPSISGSVSNGFTPPFQSFPSQTQSFAGQQKGTAGTAYRTGQEVESGHVTPILHVGSLNVYTEKSTEELRHEDYQYNKGASRVSTGSFPSQRNTEMMPRPAANPFAAFPSQSNSSFPQSVQPQVQPSSSFPSATPFPQPATSGYQPNTAQTYGFQPSFLQQDRGMASAPTPVKSFPPPQINPFGGATQGFPAAGSATVNSEFPMTSRAAQSVCAPTSFPMPSSQPQFFPPQPSSHPFHQPVSESLPPQSTHSQQGQVQFPPPQNPAGFQPQPALPASPCPVIQSIPSYNDHLGLTWLFPNGVPEELKVPQPSFRSAISEDLLRMKQPVTSQFPLESMSEHWRRSKIRQHTHRSELIKPNPPVSSVFTRKPFKELNLKPHVPPQESPYELKRAPGKSDQTVEIEPGRPPKLGKTGYYTKPGLEELGKMSSGELKRVKGFTVGSDDGKVEFEGETDVEDLELDSIIIIEPRAVVIYPEGTVKPGINQKLNKSAVITLYRCIPKSSISPSTFERRVRKVCEKNGAEFLSYNSNTGEWVFRVPHF